MDENELTCCPICGRAVPITRLRYCAACYNRGVLRPLMTAERLRTSAERWENRGWPKAAARRREYADLLDAGKVPTPEGEEVT